MGKLIESTEGTLIKGTQRAFIKGRQITEGVLIENELVELIANELVDSRLKTGKLGLIFEVDIEKDYDHVNWEFILWVFDKMVFD